MTVKTPQPPPLPDELERLMRRLGLPHIRKAAPEVVATAAAQRWEPAEVLRVLLSEEAAGRDRATIALRRCASGLPAGKTFDAREADASSIPKRTKRALKTLEWVGRAEGFCACGQSGSGKSHLVEALGHLAIDKARPSPGTRWRHSPRYCAANAPTTPSPRRSGSSSAPT
jgi:DNA replication protein DnaC